MPEADDALAELRGLVGDLRQLKDTITFLRDQQGVWQMQQNVLAPAADRGDWNFTTFEKYINQRFSDLALQLRERYEAQQIGVTAALAAAEKAVTAALIAAEKAVDKAERAQELRNQVANEFRDSLSDLSGLMWTTKEGQAAVDSVRREFMLTLESSVKRIGTLETEHANIQGRIWAVSALFSITVLLVSIGSRFIGH
jgi:hypothetical protein